MVDILYKCRTSEQLSVAWRKFVTDMEAMGEIAYAE